MSVNLLLLGLFMCSSLLFGLAYWLGFRNPSDELDALTKTAASKLLVALSVVLVGIFTSWLFFDDVVEYSVSAIRMAFAMAVVMLGIPMLLVILALIVHIKQRRNNRRFY